MKSATLLMLSRARKRKAVNTLLVVLKRELGVLTMAKVTIVHMSWWCVREQVGEKQVVTRHSLHRL